MGREIEIKLPLTDAQYEKIYSVISGREKLARVELCDGGNFLCGLEHIIKTDTYFSRYETREESKAAGEPQVIRLRSEMYEVANDGDRFGCPPPKAFFCIKRKSIENGIELNREDETYVDKPEVVRDLLLISGYHQFFEKNKDSFSIYCKSDVLPGCEFHLELEKVNGLKYLEVEVTDEAEVEGQSKRLVLPANSVRAGLEKFVELFGLDASKRDGRSWMEILEATEGAINSEGAE